MLKHILVPLDGSHLAECVLPHAITIAKAFHAKLTLAHILEQPSGSRKLPQADPLDWYLKKSAANLYLETIKTRLEEHDLPVETVLVEGRAAEKIVKLAHTTQTDLLILSGYGETSVTSGSVSRIVQHVLQQVRISTLIVRTSQPTANLTTDLSYNKILVGLDGSQRAGNALIMVSALAKAYDSELLLVHVVTKPEMPRHMPLNEEDAELVNRVIERNREEGVKYLEQTQTLLNARTRTHLLVSENVAATLQSVCEQEQTDLMVLSAHGYSGEVRWPYGSVTSRFITDGTIPLLIVQDLQKTGSEPSRSTAENRPETRLPLRLANDS